MSIPRWNVGALILLQLAASLCHLGEATAARRRRARHTYPSPEPTAEPVTAAATDVSGGRDGIVFGDYVFDTNKNAWVDKASSPPVAQTTSAPETPADDTVNTDAVTTDANKDMRTAASSPPVTETTSAPETPAGAAFTTNVDKLISADGNKIVWKETSWEPVPTDMSGESGGGAANGMSGDDTVTTDVWIGTSPQTASAPEMPTDNAVTTDAYKHIVWVETSSEPVATHVLGESGVGGNKIPRDDAVTTDVWIAASSPPIAQTTSAPEIRPDNTVTTDASNIVWVETSSEPVATHVLGESGVGGNKIPRDDAVTTDVWIAASSPPIAQTTSAPEIRPDNTVTTDAYNIVWVETSSEPVATHVLDKRGGGGNEMPRDDAVATDVWIAASSPPIAQTTSAPEMPGDDDTVTTDAEGIAAPVYALSHGRGVFAVTGGTGCYMSAQGQAQVNFGVQTSRVDLFVPSITWIFGDIAGSGMGPQDTSWNRATSDGRRLDDNGGAEEDANSPDFDHRFKSSFECDILCNQNRGKFCKTISLDLKRHHNPSDNTYIADSTSSYHEHGSFVAQEEWFAGISGEYSLSCVHHECRLSFHFGVGPSTNEFSRRPNGEEQITSLSLQGTTELAFQGTDTDRLVCIENCGGDNSTNKVNVEIEAERYETINVRNFDNTGSLVHLSGHGAGGKKCEKRFGPRLSVQSILSCLTSCRFYSSFVFFLRSKPRQEALLSVTLHALARVRVESR